MLMPAVSARRVLGPSLTSIKPFDFAIVISSSLNPPSGPMAIFMLQGLRSRSLRLADPEGDKINPVCLAFSFGDVSIRCVRDG